MNIVALTFESFSANAQKIAGGSGLVMYQWEMVAQQRSIDLLFVFLHPAADGKAWVDEHGRIVVTAGQLSVAQNLHGAIVFVGACYGLENDEMITALNSVGVKAIIAGPGVNIGGSGGWLSGADIMAGALRGALQMGLPIGAAWTLARSIVRVAKARGRAGAEDALAYRLLSFGVGKEPPSSAKASDASGQPSPVRTAAQGKERVAAVIAGVAGLLLMLLNALSGGPVQLTFFSSILPPPAQVAVWEKTAYRNADEVDLNATIYLTDTDALTVTDWITPSETITFTLVEAWDTAAISLTNWSASAGGVMTDSGVLTWTVTDAITTGYGLTKTWSVAAGDWTTSHLSERLRPESGEEAEVLLHLEHWDVFVPTPTPTVTPTPQPTSTRTPTPIPTRYVLTSVPFGTATPRPTVLCCQVTPGARAAYTIFLPMIQRNVPYSIDPPIGGGG